MPNGHVQKEYGPHSYPYEHGTSDCSYNCGCWMGPYRSGGPIGVDPHGDCPNNPKDGKRRTGSVDHEDVVTQRIQRLERQVYEAQARAEKAEAQLDAGQAKLIADLQYRLVDALDRLEKIKRLLFKDIT